MPATSRMLLLGCCLAGAMMSANAWAQDWQVFPNVVALSGPNASTAILVHSSTKQQMNEESSLRRGTGRQLPPDAFEVRSLDPKIADYVGGRVISKGNGSTELIVSVRDTNDVLRIPVIVRDTEQPVQWQFDAHVQSILSRQGCNSGACHGALAGKGGFRLSLRGYDSLMDHHAITRQDRGRRIEPSDPRRSLLLSKPSGQLPHKGGLRLEEGSPDYQLIEDWIVNGSPGPQKTDARLLGIEVLPPEQRLETGWQQQLLVLAHYADGRTEEVTHWAKFNSSNETVAQVDEDGRVTVMGQGKGAIVVWFASRLTLASLVVPPSSLPEATAYSNFQPSNLIDDILLEEWKGLGVVPAELCDDSTFLRRASLAATGMLPRAEKVQSYLQDKNPEKQQQLIDELLSSESYVDYWAYQWSDLLLINSNLLRPLAVASFYKWIREQVQANTPWDEFAKSIVLAKGDSFEQGATNFYAIHQDPEALTENTCQAFLGLSIGCAKCHNHPLEKWTNDQYYAMANLYARVRAKGWGGDPRNGDGQRTLVVLDRGDLIQPSRGQPQPPAPLDAAAMSMDDPRDRREVLASWLISDNNHYFARSIANRVWANFMGAGLIEPIDDLRVSNPASSERLLDALADHLVKNNYDLKSLMRLIMTSKAFRLSSVARVGSEHDLRLHSHYLPRRLMAEVLHDAVTQVTGVPTRFTEVEFLGSDRTATDLYPPGTQALELYDSAVANYFLKTFGRHQRRITCDCERSDQPTVVQALHLNNGDTLNNKLSDPSSNTGKWIELGLTNEQMIERAFITTLCRLPEKDEYDRLLPLLSESDAAGVSRRETIDDLVWSLMTSSEFLFLY